MYGEEITINSKKYFVLYGALVHQHLQKKENPTRSDLIKVTEELCYYSVEYGQRINKLPFDLSLEEFLFECNQDPEGYTTLVLMVNGQHQNSPLYQAQTEEKTKKTKKSTRSKVAS